MATLQQRRGGPTVSRFVVQQHGSPRRHYDLGLEIGQVLVCWSIPEGPSLDPRVQRVARRTADQPIEYGDFEGVIEDGAVRDAVLLWDAGTFDNLDQQGLHDGLARGRLTFRLWGAKLEGAFTLTRLESTRDCWLLEKLADETADLDYDLLQTDARSIKSGRTLGEIARAESQR